MTSQARHICNISDISMQQSLAVEHSGPVGGSTE